MKVSSQFFILAVAEISGPRIPFSQIVQVCESTVTAPVNAAFFIRPYPESDHES